MLLHDYDLTKPHETENVDGTEGPANQDEDIGGKPQCIDQKLKISFRLNMEKKSGNLQGKLAFVG